MTRRLTLIFAMILALAAMAYRPPFTMEELDNLPCVETLQPDGSILMSSIVACYGDE